MSEKINIRTHIEKADHSKSSQTFFTDVLHVRSNRQIREILRSNDGSDDGINTFSLDEDRVLVP